MGVSGVGTQAAIRVCTHPRALGLCTQAASPLIWVHTNQASGVCWGCLSGIHSPGAEGVGVQEAKAAAESSLNSRYFLFEKFFLFKPPGPNKHLASHTA